MVKKYYKIDKPFPGTILFHQEANRINQQKVLKAVIQDEQTENDQFSNPNDQSEKNKNQSQQSNKTNSGGNIHSVKIHKKRPPKKK